jgi:hypothetical protein
VKIVVKIYWVVLDWLSVEVLKKSEVMEAIDNWYRERMFDVFPESDVERLKKSLEGEKVDGRSMYS